MNFFPAASIIVFLVCTHSVAYVIGVDQGATTERTAWIAHEGERTTELANTLTREREDQAERIERLESELRAARAACRAQPAPRPRDADEECKALPSEWRRRWND